MAKPDILKLEIHHWVVALAEGWTAQQAEDRMDALRKATRTLVRQNQANQPQWISLKFGGPAEEIAVKTEGGKFYLVITYPLNATVGPESDPQLVREAIGTLMQAYLADLSAGIYSYRVPLEDFGALSPVSYVQSAGDDFSGGMTFG